MPAARSRSIQMSRGVPGEERPPTDRALVEGALDLVGVVALGARFVAQDVDELGVHALAAEPDLDQLAVGTAVEEVREGRAQLPVRLDLRGRALRTADHATERREHPVVERRLRPTPGAGVDAATQQREHRRGDSRNAAPLAAARTSTKIGPGAVARELGAEPCLRFDEEREVVDRARRRATGPAPRVHEPRVHGSEVAVTEAAALDNCFGPVHQRDVGVAEQRVHLVGVVGGDDLLVAMPGATPRDAVVDRRGLRAHHPHDRRTEVGEDHARNTPGHAEAEIARADGDLDDRDPPARTQSAESAFMPAASSVRAARRVAGAPLPQRA